MDATWIHPESYPAANRVLERLHGAVADLREKETAAALAEKAAQVDLESLSKEVEVGTLTLRDILAQLARPGRDPREDLPAPVFKRGIVKMEDLSPGMELTGTVLNVVDFGCFVDIGMHQGGLVHVSRLADRFVRDPHDVVAVGDIVRVWVTGVDKERKRVSLTMISPEQERARRRPPSEKGESAPSGGRRRPATAQSQSRPAGAPPPAEQQRQRPPRVPAGQSGERPPARRGGPPQRGGPRGRDQGRPPQQQYRPRPVAKPLIPITDAMKAGAEPMRTFGDLLQFYHTKTVADVEHAKPAAEAKPAEAAPPPVATPAAPPVIEAAPPPVDSVLPLSAEPPAAEAALPAQEQAPVAAEDGEQQIAGG